MQSRPSPGGIAQPPPKHPMRSISVPGAVAPGSVSMLELDKVEIPIYNTNMELQKHTRENMAQLLRSHGINPTHQRIEIGYALFEHPQH